MNFAIRAAILSTLALLAGCGGTGSASDKKTIEPVRSTTTESPTTTADNAKSDPGVAGKSLPASFTYRVGGWTFDVAIASVPRFIGEKTVDPTQPPGVFALSIRSKGRLRGSITSKDADRVAPIQELGPLLEYKSYSGPSLPTPVRSTPAPGCNNSWDITFSGMGGEVNLGTESHPRSDVVYCGGVESISSDSQKASERTAPTDAGPMNGDPLMPEADVDAVLTFLEQASPAIYIDSVAEGRPTCRFRLAEKRVVVVGGPCELLDTDGNPQPDLGADFTSGQIWGGSYLCNGQRGAISVAIGPVAGSKDGLLAPGATFDATVSFEIGDESGSYSVRGAAVDGHTITMVPGDWIDKSGVTAYTMDTFNATITGQLMEGSITGCGSIGYGNDGPFTLTGTA